MKKMTTKQPSAAAIRLSKAIRGYFGRALTPQVRYEDDPVVMLTEDVFAPLISAAGVVCGLAGENERMKRDYPLGTCNAEDAWSDFGKREEQSWKQLREALKALR